MGNKSINTDAAMNKLADTKIGLSSHTNDGLTSVLYQAR